MSIYCAREFSADDIQLIKLLNPKMVYRSEDAFNALSDLHHLELAAAGQVYFPEEPFAFSTCDRALAALWCALSPRGVSKDGATITFTLDLTEELFPRLATDELLQVGSLLSKGK